MSVLCLLLAIGPAGARTLRWSMQDDAPSLDPHFAEGEAARILLHQIYQGLTRLNDARRPEPLLARGWSSAEGGTVWRFYLRGDVRFHDGRRMRADDVVFSIRRAARNPSRQVRDLRHIAQVSAVGEQVVKIVTRRPDALLPARLATVMIMSRDWVVEQNRLSGRVSPDSWDPILMTTWHADFRANGTGPYKLADRKPAVETGLVANPAYWDQSSLPADGFKNLVFRPLEDPTARIAALVKGDVDVVLDPPAAALEVLEADNSALSTVVTPEPESLLIGFDVGSRDNAWDSVHGANPFADARVRRAVALAVDAEAIRNVILRGRSLPSGLPVPPIVEGWSKELDSRLAVDLEGAKELLAEAGYADGFSVTLHCPADGYPGNGAICRAIGAMLGLAGIEVTVRRRPLPRHLAALREGLSAFYLLPWDAPSFDSRQTLEALYHTPDGDFGDSNYSRYSDPEMDAAIEKLASTFDPDEADALRAETWRQAIEPLIYVPLHHRINTWVMRRAFSVRADGFGLPDFAQTAFDQPSPDLEQDRPVPTGPGGDDHQESEQEKSGE